MTWLYGCKVEPLSPDAARGFLRWAAGEQGRPDNSEGLIWLLAHCHDGVVWGRWTGEGWALSGQPFPHISPPLRAEWLLELRLFGPEREALVWRSGREFRGRILTDTGESDASGPLAPVQDRHVLIGDRLLEPSRNGFTLVGDASGSRHAVPLDCSEEDLAPGRRLSLTMVHYLTQDPDTGVVRVAATRLSGLEKGERQR